MRLEPHPPGRYPWYRRLSFWRQRRSFGAVLDSVMLWARSPRLFLGLALLYGTVDRHSAQLEPSLRSLLINYVSQLNGCKFCVDLNSAGLEKRDVSLDKLRSLESWRDSAQFEARERVALEYAEAITLSDREVDDGLWLRARQHFHDDELVALIAIIALQNMSSKFNSALAVPSQGFCQIPSQRSGIVKNRQDQMT